MQFLKFRFRQPKDCLCEKDRDEYVQFHCGKISIVIAQLAHQLETQDYLSIHFLFTGVSAVRGTRAMEVGV